MRGQLRLRPVSARSGRLLQRFLQRLLEVRFRHPQIMLLRDRFGVTKPVADNMQWVTIARQFGLP